MTSNWTDTILRYIFGEIPDAEFEEYINGKNELETSLEHDDYIDVISRNYTKQNYRPELKKIIEKYTPHFQVEIMEVKSLLRRFLNGIGDPADIIDELYNKIGKHPYVYNLAIQSVNGVDDLPRLRQKKNWQEGEFEKTRKWFTEALPHYQEIAKTILDSFDSGDLMEESGEVRQSPEFKKIMGKYAP
jgi:hypothetical protein